MSTKISTLAIAATALVALVQPPVVAADDPVPSPSTVVPAPPTTPDVTVTPSVGESGASIDVGVGETALQIGAGPGGASLGMRPRGSNPAPKTPGADAGAPVSTPGDRRGRSRTIGSGGRGPVLFGPTKSAAAHRNGARASSPTGRRSHVPTSPSKTGAGEPVAEKKAGSVPPFLELVDRIPTAFKLALVALGLIALVVWVAWVRTRRRLERNAFVDPVTGIANAPAFEGLLERELERAKRYKRPLALLELEVSEARHGRMLHDQALRAVTTAIRERLREGDIIARIGPSRFAIISPEATESSAETLGRSLELRLEEMRLHAVVGAVGRQPTDLSAARLVGRAEDAITAREVARERRRGRAMLRAA
jgi:diguanylate cyclase (GGDEF)-like protein